MRSVRFVLAGKRFSFNVAGVMPESLAHRVSELTVTSDEPRMKVLIQPEHIVRNQNLSVASYAGADADGGYLQRRGDFFRKRRRDFFKDDRENARGLKRESVIEYFFGFRRYRAAGTVGAELVNGLRRQSQVPHDGNADFHQPFDCGQKFFSAFEFDGFRV